MPVGQRSSDSGLRGSGQRLVRRIRLIGAIGLGLVGLLGAPPADAQYRKIGEMKLRLSGVSATVENAEPVVPKNTPGGLRILVRAGGVDLSLTDLARFLGPDFAVQGDLSGPGFSQPIALPYLQPGEELPADPLILPTPPIAIAGSYRLSNLRIVANGRTVLDVDPSSVPLRVIDQILVTSVTTRALTLDEIRGKGIVLDSDDYLGFEFTMGFKLDSKAINLKFPVVFDRQGAAVPQPLTPPAAPERDGISGLQLPTIVPLLLEAEGEGGEREEIMFTNPSGVSRPISIPAVLVIPGNVGYLKQFFSAQLYVSNGAPVGSGLNVRDIKAKLKLPPGVDLEYGTVDDPLALPELERDGRVITQPLVADVRGVGPDGLPGTDDDVAQLAPAEQGQVEFLIRGEKEGFHQIDFDLTAQLLGLPIGPVTVKGKATGGVLVRNPFFNVTFTVPSVVRRGEHFKMRATITNIGKGIGNDVSMTLDSSRMSGLILVGDATKSIPTLKSGDARGLEFEFISQRTGKVVATYLKLDTQDGSTGRLNFTIGVGERNVPLSPDTLVLPASTDALPLSVVDAAMRVLGQAWSIANAPAGTLPQGVIRVNGQLVVKKALALAEAGLRATLGQSSDGAVRDLLYDFFSGGPVDPGFDQLLRSTEAGHDFVRAVGEALGDAATSVGGGTAYEFETARILASSAPFASFAWDGGKGDLAVVDGAGRSTVRSTNLAAPVVLTAQNVVSAVLTPLGSDMILGLVTQPSAGPYHWEFRAGESALGTLSATFERPDGSFGRVTWTGFVIPGTVIRVVPDVNGGATLEKDSNGDGIFESSEALSSNTLPADGPSLVAGAIIGPETLDGAGPWGFQTALVFDRVVGEASAATISNYEVPNNTVRSARRQLSGRLVFSALTLPEGPYVATSVAVHGLEDSRGAVGPGGTVPLSSRLEEIGAVVSGRVLNAEGTPLAGRTVTYIQNADPTCISNPLPVVGLAAVITGQSGEFELRYVRQDQCGIPFSLNTVDPASGAVRAQSHTVRDPGQQIVADFVMVAAGSVRGVVKNLSGQPVPGATVTVLSQTETQIGASTTTDGLGVYAVSGITVGPVVVRAGKGNGVGSAAGRIDRPSVPAVINVTIDGGSVSARGVIRKVEGVVATPAVGAVVNYSVPHPSLGSLLVGSVLTDALGRYSLSGLPVGPFTIRAQVNTRDGASVSGVAAGGDDIVRDISVEIPPVESYGYVEGVVQMPDGVPAPGVIVSATFGSLLTDADGRFRIPVRPQLSALTVSASTRDRKRSGFTTALVNQAGQTATGALITLSGLGAAEFTVLDHAGQPLVARTVRLLDSAVDPCGRTSAVTDALGRARFSNLGLGSVLAQVQVQGEVMDAVRGSASIPGDGQTGFSILRVDTRASTIVGLVVDAFGQPVFGAEVALTSRVFVNDPGAFVCGMESRITHQTRTGLDGRFRFNGVHPGPVGITARQDFFPTPVGTQFTLQPTDEASVTLTLVNTISGEISGTVYEPDGITPAGSGVEVTLNGALPDVTVGTNGVGHFRFAKIFPAGSYTLTARDPSSGFVERSTIYIARAVDAVHDIRLKGKARVRVTVTDVLAQPVAQAYVTLGEIAFPNRVFEGVVAPSNQGVVEFPGVFEGQVSLEVKDPFGRGGRSSLTIPSGVGTVDAVVRVSTTGTVRGRFLMPDSTPIPFGSLKVTVGGRLVGQVTASANNPAGGFEFTYVPSGGFRLEALDPLTGRTGIATGSIEVEGQIVNVDVRAQGIGTVSGLVTSNGVPSRGSHVDLVSGSYSAVTTTDSDGRYSVQGVPEGRVVVSADNGNGFLRATNAGTLQGEGSTLTLDVALRGTGSITGQVFKADGSTPAGVVGVSLYVGGAGGGSVTGSSGDDGTFWFDRVPAGLAQISIDALGSDDFATGTFEVPVGGEAQVTLSLNGIGGLRGRGLDSSIPGAPTPGRMVIQVGPSQRRATYYIDLAADGRFELPRVLAGPFTAQLSVTTSGLTLYGTASGQVSDGQTTEVEVQLQPSATITGKVLRADGVTAAYGSNVTVRLASGAQTTVQAQPDGRFTFRGATLGAFTVTVADPVTTGVARAIGSLTENGQTADLGDLVLDDSAVQVVSVDPVDGTVGVAVHQAVRVTFTDPLQHSGSIRVLNGTSQVSGAGTLSPDGRVVTLLPGSTWPDSRELTVEANTGVTDIFGRHPAQTFTSRFRTQDLSPPTVASILPASTAIQVDPGASITVTFSEPLSETTDLANLIRVTQGATVFPGTTTLEAPTQATFVPASPWPINTAFSVVVNGARDLTGNTQTTAFQASFKSLDTVSPTLSLSSPTAGAWTTSRRPSIFVSLADNLAGIEAATGTLRLDAAPVAASLSAGSISFTPAADLADGQHAVEASVRDRALNLGALAAAFGVDATPPNAAEITSGVSAGAVVAGSITLSATSFDATSGLARIEVVEGASVRATLLPPSFTASYNTNALAEGAHTFQARAVDVAGNVGPLGSAVSFFVDNKVLTLTITAPTNNLRIRDSVTASATTSEPVARVAFSVGSSAFDDLLAPYSAVLDTSALPEGNYTLTAIAYALTGEPTSTTVTVFVDRTPPLDVVPSLMTADDQGSGLAQVAGRSGAAPGASSVEVRKLGTALVSTIAAAADGSFATRVAAAEGDFVEVRSLDSVGNASQWLPLEVVRSLNGDGLPQNGMLLWVKADVGVSADASGFVSSWADQSGRGNHLVQSTSTRRPLVVADGFNGFPVIRFDGNSDYLQFPRLTNIRTVFFVMKEDTAATANYRFLLGDGSTNHYYGGHGAPGSLWLNGYASASVTNGLTVLNGILVNGTTTLRPRTMSVLSVTTTGDTTANWFGSQNGTASFWWGDLAEMIIYDRPVTDSERVQVEAYLAQKYRPYPPATSTPRISPAGGVFSQSTTVTLAAQPGATVYYSLDGSEPSESSATSLAYSEPFTVTATTTVKARGFKAGLDPSGVATATFIEAAAAPVQDGMALWVRADAGIATDVTFSSVWADQSGRGNHLVQTEGLSLPRLIPDAGNGLPAMRFDGNSDYLKFTTRLTNIRTVFWVVKEDTAATANYRFLLGDGSTNHYYGGHGAPGSLWLNGYASASVTNGLTVLNGAPVNGTTTLRPRTMSVLSVTTTGDTTANWFGSQNGTASFWWGDLAEMIVYDRALTAQERAQVEGYLTARYAIGDKVLAPVVSPNGGLFANEVEVSMSTPTPGAEIHYTLDGTDPTVLSESYTGPFTLTATKTLKARAFKANLTDSSITTVGFTKDTDFTPKSVSGMQLWLRADAGAPSGVGDLWEDQSGLGHHAFQTASLATPVVVSNVANGLPAMRFDGNADYLKFTTRLTNIRTVFWVVKEDAAATANYRFLLGDGSTNHYYGGHGAPGSLWLNGYASASVTNGLTVLNGMPVNGTTTLRPRTMSVLSVTTTGDTTANWFGSQNGTASFWWGDLAEMIIYDRALTTAERQQVEEYLRTKYRTPDLSPPTVASISPGNTAIQVDPGASITVTFSKPLSQTTDFVNLIRVTQGATVFPGTTTLQAPAQATFVPASPWPINTAFSVVVNGARDLIGNTQTTAFEASFKSLDTVSPTLSLSSPTAGTWTTNPRPSIFVSLADNLAGVDAATGTLRLDGAPVAASLSAVSISLTPAADLADGQHAVEASVRDRALNLGALAAAFGVDATPPNAAEITSGVSAGAVVVGSITLSATSFDATSGLARIEVLEGATVRATLLPPSFTASYNTNALSQGAHTFAARGVDVAGNVGPLGTAIPFSTQETSPPTVTSIAPANLAIQVGSNSTITVTFSEAISETTNLASLIQLKRGGIVLTGVTRLLPPNQAEFTPTAPLPINASFAVFVNGARDLSGNTQTAAFSSSFKSLDTIAPGLSLNAPPSGGWTASRRPFTVIGLSDSLSGIDAPTGALLLDGASTTPARATGSMTFTPTSDLAEGQHRVDASVQDRAANIGRLSAGFGVDATPPDPAEITSGVSPGAVVTGWLLLSATSFDAVSGVKQIELFDGAARLATLFPPSFNAWIDTSYFADGVHSLQARAVDRAGNVGPFGTSVPVISVAFGTVGVHVTRGGNAVIGESITVTSSHPEASATERSKLVVSDASGSAATAMPIGSIVARVTLDGVSYEASGVLLQGQWLSLEISLPAPIGNVVTGRVFASDEATPLEGATVTIAGLSTITDGAGVYALDALAIPAGPHEVQLMHKGRIALDQVEVSGASTYKDFVHWDVGVYKFRVLRSTGEAIPGATVSACLPVGQGCSAGAVTGADGVARFAGLPVPLGPDRWLEGEHLILVALPEGGVSRNSTDLYGGGGTRSEDLVIYPEGRIQGRVLNQAGDPAAGIILRAWASPSYYSIVIEQAVSDDNGDYRFDHVGGEDVTIKATDAFGVFEQHQEASVAIGGTTTAPDIALPLAGLAVRVEDSNQAAVSGALVSVTSLDRDGRYDPDGNPVPFVVNLVTNPQGLAAVSLPPGLVRLILTGESPSAAEADLSPNAPIALTLEAGSHHAPTALGAFNLCAGYPSLGPCSEDGSISAAQTYIASRPANGERGTAFDRPVPLFRSQASSAGTTQTGVSLWASNPLVHFKQSVFVPVSGAFARSLTSFTNTSTQAVTVFATTGGRVGTCCDTVEADGYFIQDGALGVVFGADGGLTVPDGNGDYEIWHTLRIPAQATRSILSFTTPDASLAPALRDLSAPGALADLGNDERPLVANFDVPLDPSFITLDGVAQTAEGGALDGATVALTRNGRLILQGIADADGAFLLSGSLIPGSYSLVIVSGGQVAIREVAVTVGATHHLGPVPALSPEARGSARVVVEDATGASVAGLELTARVLAMAGLDLPVSGFTDAQGVAVVSDLIPGLNRIDTPLGPAFVRVVSGGPTTVRIQRGPYPGSATGRITFNGAPVPGAGVAVTQLSEGSNEVVVARATADADGRYVLTGFEEHNWFYVYAWDPDEYRNTWDGFSPSPGERTVGADVDLAQVCCYDPNNVGSLLIRAYSDQSGAQAAGHVATVTFEWSPLSVDVVLDSAGEARLTGLPSWEEVRVTVNGALGSGSGSLYVPSDQETVLTVPICCAPATLDGVAQTAQGGALDGATVALTRDGQIILQGTAGADGAFFLSGTLISGSYSLVIVSGGQVAIREVAVTAGATHHLGPVPALSPEARGSARVIVEDGTGASVAGLELAAQASAMAGLDPPVTGFTDAQGEVVLLDLIPGLNRIDTPLGPAFVRVVSGGLTKVRILRGADPGSLAGRITFNGAPVPGAIVAGTQSALDGSGDVLVARATADADGRYVLSGLREGEGVSVYALDPDLYRNSIDVWFRTSTDGPTVGADFELAGDGDVGSLLIRAYSDQSGAPAAGHVATLTFEYSPLAIEVTLDSSGEALVPNLSYWEEVTVTVNGALGSGSESLYVPYVEETVLNVAIGNRVPFPATLPPFTLWSSGVVSENVYSCTPFCLSGQARVGGYAGYSWPRTAAASQDARELTLTLPIQEPVGDAGVFRLTRRLYVPGDGHFARLVDVIENTGAVTNTASYRLSTRFESMLGGGVTEVLDGLVEAGDSAFVLQSGEATAETAGFAIRGPLSQSPGQFNLYEFGGKQADFGWDNLVLGPGEKVAFMSFVVFDRGAGAATVGARTLALMNLTDPLALAGLSSEDRALIRNWILP